MPLAHQVLYYFLSFLTFIILIFLIFSQARWSAHICSHLHHSATIETFAWILILPWTSKAWTSLFHFFIGYINYWNKLSSGIVLLCISQATMWSMIKLYSLLFVSIGSITTFSFYIFTFFKFFILTFFVFFPGIFFFSVL